MTSKLSKPKSPSRSNEDEFENLVADFFREHSWRVKKESLSADKRVDIIAVHGDKRYIFQCKAASEGRQDRLLPLLSQAILQARVYAQAQVKPAAPLAVVAAPAISLSAVNSLVSFRSQFAFNLP